MKPNDAYKKFVAGTKYDMKKWKHTTLNLLPNGKIVVQCAGNTTKVTDKELSRVLMKVYFGKKPVSKKLKKGMVGNIGILLN